MIRFLIDKTQTTDPRSAHLHTSSDIEMVSLTRNKRSLPAGPHTREKAFILWSINSDLINNNPLHKSLLSRSKLHPNLLKLPLDILRTIWIFLNINTLSLCEALILETLFKNYKLASSQDRLQQPEGLRQKTIKEWQLTRAKHNSNLTTMDDIQTEAQKKIALEQEEREIAREKETLLSTIQEITDYLDKTIFSITEKMSDQSEAELSIVMRFTDHKSKEDITSYLLNQLFGCYSLCSIYYEDKNSVDKYEKQYSNGIKRLNFVERYCSEWLNSSDASSTVKISYRKTMENANIVFFKKCKPPHPFKTNRNNIKKIK